MSSPLQHALRDLANGRVLTSEETAAAFGVIMRGEASPVQIAALLMGLRARGETAEEVAGAAQALRLAMIPVETDHDVVIDTCGTGGGNVGTFNLSTAAAFVAAGAGARVAKHGNRSYTSKCGSADVLEALGVTITLGAADAARHLGETGMVFLFAPNYHPAMRHVGPTRKELGVATIMNLLGPLANPAGVRHQVIGVADRARAPLMADALARLGAEHALVVHGTVGMDEISTHGKTEVWEVRHGDVTTWVLDPVRHGLDWDGLDELAGGEPAENAVRIERLLAGNGHDEGGRRAVTLNAAAALYVAGLADRFDTAVSLAHQTLKDGRGYDVLQRLRGGALAG